MAIPFSMLISFVVLRAMGVTLNIVVLFSLVLALGMLVDNAIVIVENIYRHAQMGKHRVQATLDGVSEVAWPIISSTATTVGAFLPLLFWPGIMGEFMWFMPLTVSVVLISSLFVALVINPVLCATLMNVKPLPGFDGDEAKSVPDNFFYRFYGATLRFAVKNRVLVLAVTFLTFVGTFMVYGANNHGVEFFPETTPERMYVNISLPDGSNVEASDRIVRQVEAFLENEPNIRTWVADVGAGNGDQMSFGSDGTAPHKSRITVEFVSQAEQTESPWETIAQLRESLVTMTGTETEIQTESGGPPTAPPINIEIVGAEYAELGRISNEIRAIVEEVEGTINVKTDFETGRPEVRVEVDREAAARFSISVNDVANTVRAAVNGIEASTFRDVDDEFDILVRLSDDWRDTVEDIESLTVSNVDGDIVSITEIADVVVAPGLGSVRHVDGDRVITLSADIADGYNAIAALAVAQERIADEVVMPGGYTVRYTGENKDQAESAAFLSEALMAGMFIIALILITQFNSVAQVAIILASVLLSLLGVLWGLLIREMPFNIIMTGVGVISLAGVVVNNAIVLIDYINQLKARGIPSREAVVLAGLVRLRPVLLTATTTALSLLPTVLGYSLDVKNMTIAYGGTSVDMWGPMATAVLFGLTVSTILTLVIIPVMYSSLDSFNDGVRGLVARVRAPRRRKSSVVAETIEDDEGTDALPAPAE
jgi:multidrug efflux pump